MRLAVIGAGVVGVTTAFELLQDGHEVTVFERCSTAAEGASFANGGLLAPEWAAALASDRWTRKSLPTDDRWWSRFRRTPVPVGMDPGPSILALARLGSERLDALCDQLELAPDSHQSMMVVWREAHENEHAERLQRLVKHRGGECHIMNPEQARSLELALNPETDLAGVLVLPQAWSVNCRQFTLMIRTRAQQAGCRFEFRRPVSLTRSGHRFQLVDESGQELDETFDGVVVCAGSSSAALLRSAGIELPLENWLGFGLNAAVRESMDAPSAVVQDLKYQVSISRLGTRIRVTSPLQRDNGTDQATATYKRLQSVLDDWFPGAIRRGQTGSIQQWRSEVACLPDGLPVIGATRSSGIWVNTGHGNHGWVMSCSSARLLADQVAGRDSEIDVGPYRVDR